MSQKHGWAFQLSCSEGYLWRNFLESTFFILYFTLLRISVSMLYYMWSTMSYDPQLWHRSWYMKLETDLWIQHTFVLIVSNFPLLCNDCDIRIEIHVQEGEVYSSWGNSKHNIKQNIIFKYSNGFNLHILPRSSSNTAEVHRNKDFYSAVKLHILCIKGVVVNWNIYSWVELRGSWRLWQSPLTVAWLCDCLMSVVHV